MTFALGPLPEESSDLVPGSTALVSGKQAGQGAGGSPLDSPAAVFAHVPRAYVARCPSGRSLGLPSVSCSTREQGPGPTQLTAFWGETKYTERICVPVCLCARICADMRAKVRGRACACVRAPMRTGRPQSTCTAESMKRVTTGRNWCCTVCHSVLGRLEG